MKVGQRVRVDGRYYRVKFVIAGKMIVVPWGKGRYWEKRVVPLPDTSMCSRCRRRPRITTVRTVYCRECLRDVYYRASRQRYGPADMQCQVCGRSYNLLASHIRVHGLTAVQYQAQFPDAPLLRPLRRYKPVAEEIECRLCGWWGRSLAPHLRHKHKRTTLALYRTRFPDALITSVYHRDTHRELIVDRNGEIRWTRERIISALRRFAKSAGRTPVYQDFRGGAGKYPDAGTTVVVMFGSWSAAIQAAGLPPARPRRKQHKTCKHGHLLTDDNILVLSNGMRRCIECNRRRAREYAARQRALEQAA